MGQWLNLAPTDDSMPDWVPNRKRVVEFCREIERRSRFKVWLDLRTASLTYGYIDPQGETHATWSTDLFQDSERKAPTMLGWYEHSVDATLNKLRLVDIDPSIKWKWADEWKARVENDKRMAQEVAEAELVETAAKELGDRNRRQVSQNFLGAKR